jgi:hypothetical protein
MAKEKSAKPSTKAEATAKVELVAKAVYQRKHSTTEVIPPDVTRAKTGAWLDLISPMTEWAGLKGDQIRHKREMLRIQREDVLSKIAMRAQSVLRESKEPIKKIPVKFLVPFLEKASLEDLESEIIDTWTTLLASAATQYDPHMVRFCTILSEIGAREVQFLNRLCRENRSKRPLSWIADVPLAFSVSELTDDINKKVDVTRNVEDNIDSIIERCELPGGLLLVLGIGDSDGSDEVRHELDDPSWESSISLLQSLGLVIDNLIISGEVERYSWFAESVALTSFGVAFVSACDPEIRKARRVG